MSARLTPTEIDTAALAHLGRAALAKLEARLARVETAIARGVPLALVYAVLARNFDATLEPVVHVERWIEERPDGIQVLRSGLGLGKSVALTVYAIATGATWVRASEVAQWTFADQGAQIERWVSYPDLVIDEVGGQGTTSPIEATRLAIVLLERWTRSRPTAISTNLSRRAFAEVFDGVDDEKASRILDRIVERGDWRDCKGASRRGQPADVASGRRRLEDWRRLARLVDVVGLAASGYDVEDLDAPTGPKAKLAALLDVRPAALTAARRELAAEAKRIADDAAPFLKRWAEEAEQARREQRAAADSVRELVTRHVTRHTEDRP